MVGAPHDADPYYEDSPEIPWGQMIDGHTSITSGGAVYYAGELIFDENRLMYWTNLSGRYKPPTASFFTQLTLNVRRLLPPSLFQGRTIIDDSAPPANKIKLGE